MGLSTFMNNDFTYTDINYAGFESSIAKRVLGTDKRYGSPRFYELLDELATLHSRKSHDYAGTIDPFSNFRESEKLGIEAWKGIAVRLTDKMSRIQAFARQGELLVNDEGLIDTLKDNAVYSLLAIILFEESKKRENAPTD
jgi:hypothetical protein